LHQVLGGGEPRADRFAAGDREPELRGAPGRERRPARAARRLVAARGGGGAQGPADREVRRGPARGGEGGPAPGWGPVPGGRRRRACAGSPLAETAARGGAGLALSWLARHAGVERGLCAVVEDGVSLVGLIGRGLPTAAVEGFRIDLAQRSHPLVLALASRDAVAFSQGVH